MIRALLESCMVAPSFFCVVCRTQDAAPVTERLNGLPVGVVACEDCQQAVRDREVGVSWCPDGRLLVIDGRVAA